MSGLDAVDRIEAHTRSNVASGKFTPEGVKDDALKFALGDLVPTLHRARTTIKKAKAEVADRKSKLKVEGPDKSDVAGAFRRMEISNVPPRDERRRSEKLLRPTWREPTDRGRVGDP